MRRLPAVLGLIALAGCGSPPPPSTGEVLAPAGGLDGHFIISNPVMGAAGCSARGCHGGPASVDEKGRLDATWGNAYTVWARHDKHAECGSCYWVWRRLRAGPNDVGSAVRTPVVDD